MMKKLTLFSRDSTRQRLPRFGETRQRRGNRAGSLMAALLVALAAGGMILFGAVAYSLKLHRQTRNELMLEQTNWLLDAGVSQAVRALETNPDYDGETITVALPLRELQGELKISIERSGNGTPIQVVVIARLDRIDRTPIDSSFQRSCRFRPVRDKDLSSITGDASEGSESCTLLSFRVGSCSLPLALQGCSIPSPARLD